MQFRYIHIPAKLEDPREPLPSVPGTVTMGALVDVLGVGVLEGATEGVAAGVTEGVVIGATEGEAMGATEGVTTACRKYNSIQSLKRLTLIESAVLLINLIRK